MRTFLKLTLTATLLLTSVSNMNAQWGNKKIEGNGDITTKTITTQSYDNIKAVGSMDVHLERGTEGKITITTDSNLLEYIIVELEGDVLVVRTENNVSLKTNKGIHVTIPFEAISGISLVGSGDLDSKDVVKTDTFEVAVTGSGGINLALDSASVDAKITGSGDMTLSGNTQELEVKISGSGDFKGNNLSSTNTQAYVSGSGDAEVNAKSSLKARVSGSGDIRYSGHPDKSDTKVMGSGSISTN